MTLSFIGGGNMATALITGLLESPELGSDIRVADPSPEARERLSAMGCTALSTASEAVVDTDVVVLAVKPQIMPAVFSELAGNLADSTLVVSVAAGITIAGIRQGFQADLPVVRTMPNTPALLGAGITGLFADARCSDAHRRTAEAIMNAVGETVWVDNEGLIDVVTAISGSGPAYFYRMIEALSTAGTSLGLPSDVAARLALHTAHGAGRMALESDVDAAELRRRVTSPGGTTQAALEAMNAGEFDALMHAVAEAAVDRGRELARGAASS